MDINSIIITEDMQQDIYTRESEAALMNDWKKITKEQLEQLYYEEQLSDKDIAELYNVSRSTVLHKRQKYGVSRNIQQYKSMARNHKELFEELNSDSYKRLKALDIDSIAKALTHYAFRNGPVEDMHSYGKLMEEDMKILNKFMVNRIANFLNLVKNGDWLQLELLYSYYRHFGGDWDQAELDNGEAEDMFESLMKGKNLMYTLWMNEQELKT